MPNRLYKDAKFDIGLVPQALNNSNATGRYFGLAHYREATAILLVGAMAAATTAKVEFLQAKDADGTGSTTISSASATITANTDVTKATVALATVADTDVVTINGINFTKAAATDATAREFADAAGLVTCVNDATYGVEGVFASAASTTVTLVSEDPGEYVITVAKTENAGTITLATVEAIAYVNLLADNLDADNSFTHVAAKVTTTANTTVAVQLLRGIPRFQPTQNVGASATL